ncbi:MAG: ATP-grasp domain-containing protein [Chthoniobacterales bacterium]
MNDKTFPLLAVTGLGRGENPQPGFAVAASLLRNWPMAHIAGLAYDALESGIYATDCFDAVFTIPYPSVGTQIMLERIDEIRSKFPFTVLIPTLDAELELFISLRKELNDRGIQVMLPDSDALKARRKSNLPTLAAAAKVKVPCTYIANSAYEAAEYCAIIGSAVMVKGPFYEARRAESPFIASVHASRILAEWGGPIIVQEIITGTEFDLLGLGDGTGRMLGSCSIRKMVVSSQGKGYAGITVHDKNLLSVCESLLKELKWKGPLEFEFIRDKDGEFYLIEINPRFPAWVDFPAQLGCNLAQAAVENLLGWESKMLCDIPAGKIFLRHSVDMICDVEEFAALTAEGSIVRTYTDLV